MLVPSTPNTHSFHSIVALHRLNGELAHFVLKRQSSSLFLSFAGIWACVCVTSFFNRQIFFCCVRSRAHTNVTGENFRQKPFTRLISSLHCICLHNFFSIRLPCSSFSIRIELKVFFAIAAAVALDVFSACGYVYRTNSIFIHWISNFGFTVRVRSNVCSWFTLCVYAIFFYSLWPLLFGIRLLFSIIIISFDNFFYRFVCFFFLYIFLWVMLYYVWIWNSNWKRTNLHYLPRYLVALLPLFTVYYCQFNTLRFFLCLSLSGAVVYYWWRVHWLDDIDDCFCVNILNNTFIANDLLHHTILHASIF